MSGEVLRFWKAKLFARACQLPIGGTKPQAVRMKILVVGDSYMPIRYFQEVFEQFGGRTRSTISRSMREPALHPYDTFLELKLTEYQGAPSQLAEHMGGVELLSSRGRP